MVDDAVEQSTEIPDAAISRDDGQSPSPGPDESQEDKDADQLRKIMLRFQIHETFWSRIHVAALDDDRFVAGEQWDDEIQKERKEDGRPMLTYNLLAAFNRQIVNKVRQERPQLKVNPVESGSGQSPQIENIQGTKDYPIADVYGGLIKNIEHQSRADHAYDTALKHAVDHGFGYFYLRNVWSKWNPFVQELEICRVKNSYSIYMDPSAREADYSDAQDAFMFFKMNRATFEEKYPEASAADFASTASVGELYDGWWSADDVRIAQYWWLEYVDDEVAMLSNGMIVYISETESVLDELEENEGIYVILDADGKPLRKKVKRPVCKWMKITGTDVLDRATLPFSKVPVFPVLGEEVLVDGETVYESAIRHAKDPQRSYNYWRTAAAETIALAPRAPFVLSEDQIEGHETEFEEANRGNPAFLAYKFREGQPPPARAYMQNLPAAELALAGQDSRDMQTIIGLHDASMGRESNEKSGKAILARQAQGSTSTFQFPDNLNRALEAMGRVLVEAIPRIYDTRRVLRIRLPDDTDDFVEINRVIKDQEGGEEVTIHDLAYGRYDVVVETGKSYATQRQEAAELQLDLLKVLGPERAANIVHLIVKNLGVPGSEEVAAVLRKMLPDALKSEDERAADLPKGVVFNEQGNPVMEESGEPYQEPPTPEMELAMAEQAAEGEKHKATQAMAGAKTKEAEAKIAQAGADAAAAAAAANPEAKGEQFDQGAMMQEIDAIIKAAFADHEASGTAHADVIADAIVDALRRSKGYVDRTVSGNMPNNSG
jgi:hypothetical protein